MATAKTYIETLLRPADIQINGTRAHDIQIHDERVYARVIKQGTLGFGESYMDGWWDADAVDQLIFRLLRSAANEQVSGVLPAILKNAQAILSNMQSKRRAFQIGEEHYDIGNDLYTAMLDKRLTYTCGYWKNAINLDEAQEAKLDLVCRKLQLKPGQRVLDIGCGWGSFMKFAAEKYGVSCVGVTVSKEQKKLGETRSAGLPIEFRLQDYRELNEKFDHIVSLGMFEHVGYKNYREYMEVAARCLKDDGLFLLHTIGGNTSVHSIDPWIEKYIFPNAMLPSVTQIAEASEGLFVMEDWHNFSVDYDKTLMAWFERFTAAWPSLKDTYDERFRRMWTYYLLSCAATFRARKNQLWQVVFSKHGVLGGYTSVR